MTEEVARTRKFSERGSSLAGRVGDGPRQCTGGGKRTSGDAHGLGRRQPRRGVEVEESSEGSTLKSVKVDDR